MGNTNYAKLIMVTADNNNKFYEMTDNGSGILNVKYGRIESSVQTASYPISMWSTKYNEKIRKGYKDMTHTVQVKTEVIVDDVKLSKIEDAKVEKFIELMQKYTKGLVQKTYTVEAKNVTQAQIDNAQAYLSKLMRTDKKDVQEINNLLLQLYMEIPRRMSNVKDYLLPNIKLEKVLEQEQDNLDAMAGQVAISTPKTKKEKTKAKKETKTMLDTLGITMKEVSPTKEVEYLIKQVSASKILGFFEVCKKEHDDVFEAWMKTQKNTDKRIVIHGTRCSSVLPIIEQGLKIRPAGNYQFSGKVYGDGNYFSETCVKSLGYTGYDPDQILLVYEIHIGNPFTYDGWYRGNSFSLTYKELQSRGFDSTFVKATNGLLNTEIICYKEEQCHLKYIIHLKR